MPMPVGILSHRWHLEKVNGAGDIVWVVLHLVQCILNDARSCAKEIAAMAPRYLALLLALVIAHTSLVCGCISDLKPFCIVVVGLVRW